MLELLLTVAIVGVLALAGAAKLRDPEGTAKATRDFGLPAALAPAIARLLPLVELGLALTLLFPLTRSSAAIGSVALFSIFTGLVALALLRGRRFQCRCFGQLDSSPLGLHTLARNGVFLGGGILLVWLVLTPAGDRWPALSSWQLVVLLIIVGLGLTVSLEAYLILQLMRQNGRILERLEQLEGRPAQPYTAPEPERSSTRQESVRNTVMGTLFPTVNGDSMSLELLCNKGRPLLLVFADPMCGACENFLPRLAAWHTGHATLVTLAVISRGSARAHRQWPARYSFEHVLLQRQDEILDAYNVTATPSALVLGANGTPVEPVVSGEAAIERLLTRLATIGMAKGAARHEPSPPERLADIVAIRGQPTLLLFWDPSCAHCESVFDTLASLPPWRDNGSPEPLLVVHSEDQHDPGNGLAILNDPQRQIASTLGIAGVPAAVLLDAKGFPSTMPALGAKAVTDYLRTVSTSAVNSGT